MHEQTLRWFPAVRNVVGQQTSKLQTEILVHPFSSTPTHTHKPWQVERVLLRQFHHSRDYVTGTLCLTDRHLIFIEPTGAQETWVRTRNETCNLSIILCQVVWSSQHLFLLSLTLSCEWCIMHGTCTCSCLLMHYLASVYTVCSLRCNLPQWSVCTYIIWLM